VKTLTENGADKVVLIIQGVLSSDNRIEEAGLTAQVKVPAEPQPVSAWISYQSGAAPPPPSPRASKLRPPQASRAADDRRRVARAASDASNSTIENRRSPIKRGAMMIRSTLPMLFSLTILTSEAGAQGVAIDPNTLRPSFRMPLSGNANADTYKRLPYQDLGSEIRIELAADALYDFDKGEIPSSADDYFQQAANLIFEGPGGRSASSAVLTAIHLQ
jgi:hypothetical protein